MFQLRVSRGGLSDAVQGAVSYIGRGASAFPIASADAPPLNRRGDFPIQDDPSIW